ncbi:MAG: type II toxin-antitoxin system HicA family toxin [Bacillota bacterium]
MLRSAGFEVRQPRGGSSHHFYERGALTITVPKHRPSLGVGYVNRALSLLKEDFENGQDS